MPPIEALPTEFKEWLIAQADMVLPVMDFLRRHPSEFYILATLAQLEMEAGTEGLDMYAANGPAERKWRSEQNAVKELLSTGRLLNCAECFRPAIYFGDGQKLDWPEMGSHQCKEG